MMVIRIILSSLFLSLGLFSFSAIKLPRLISDGMILQRGTPLRLWGWASPGERVRLVFNQETYQSTAAPDGQWFISLPSQKAGGPYEMQFSGDNIVTVKDILFGDVWLCSGQSNMELTMERVRYKYADLIAKINNTSIRQFEVPDQYDFKKPHADLPTGKWIPATPEYLLNFSAVAFFFAHELNRDYQVPIGLINAALGGSPAEAWISETALKQFPHHYHEAIRFRNDSLIAQIEAKDRTLQQRWYNSLNNQDLGLKQNWTSSFINDNNWPQMSIPGYWADNGLGQTNGAIWFRKEIQVPKTMVGQPADILLGSIVDADSVFINGRFIGTTSYQYPPRRYTVPTNVLKEGSNVITIRVINNAGKGGFVLDKPYEIRAGNEVIDLKGTWKYQLGAAMEPLPGQTFIRWKPLGLYNAMIAPLVNYAIKGVIWYQGESNTKAPQEYSALMTALISDWRKQWKQDDFPFLFVQLANFMEQKSEPAESNLAELRQAQLATLTVPNTAMVVTIDVGEWNDIHPLNKQDVGKRLALQAKRLAYGEKKQLSSGPLYKSIKRKGHKLIITFTDTGKGLLTLDNRALTHISIAGTDKKFVWATAQIKKNKIVVWNSAIQHPIAARYAWADNPQGANLYNSEGLPASPFKATIK